MSSVQSRSRRLSSHSRTVTVTDKDGHRYEDVVVWDCTRVVTETCEVWRFQLRGPGGEACESLLGRP